MALLRIKGLFILHEDIQLMGFALVYKYTRSSKICTTKSSLCNSTGLKLFDCKDSKYGDSFVRDLIS